jgi:hypothetical protein
MRFNKASLYAKPIIVNMSVSTGDILTLSQIAWKTGRAFTACRKDVPAEFIEVETEISSLAKALRALAETFHTDNEVLQELTQDVQIGLDTILTSCQRTVHDLDTLMDQYQVIRKHRTAGGFAIERTWSSLILAEYKTTIWTTEGGNIEDLKTMLQMHTSSVTLLSQTLERLVSVRHTRRLLTCDSKSLSRLENVVPPMAKSINSMYHMPGSLDEQLEELHHFVQNLVITDLDGQIPPIPERNPARSPVLEVQDPMQTLHMPYPDRGSSHRWANARSSLPRSPHRSVSSETCLSSSSSNVPSSPTHKSSPLGNSPRRRVSEFSFGGSSTRYSSSSCASSDAGMGSMNWPNPGPRDSAMSRQLTSAKNSPLRHTPEIREPDQELAIDMSLYPPTMSSLYRQDTARSRPGSALSPFPSAKSGIAKLHRSSTTASQKSTFEKEAFRNSAVLCDV